MMAEIKWVEVDGEMKPEWDFPAPPSNREFYEALREARPYTLAEKFTISVEETGRAFVVKAGQTARVICEEGPQMADVCLWNAHDLREHFWNEGTLSREGDRLTTFTRLWTNVPRYRPIMTIVEDTALTEPDAGHHSCLTGYCDPHYWYLALKDKNHRYVTEFNCYFNLLRAIRPFGMGREHIHDNINLNVRMFFTEDGKHVFDVPKIKQGDYVEFYAEIDTLFAISICPDGSGQLHYTEGEQDIKPLGIEIYDTGIMPLVYEDDLADVFARQYADRP
jgi:uncharacterized protein